LYWFPDAPIITITPPWSSYTASVGQPVTLLCKAEGLPTPTVQWFKNNKAVKKASNIQLQAFNVPTTSPHSTVYTCVSTNNAGGIMHTTKKNISVTVQGIYSIRLNADKFVIIFTAMCLPLQNPINGRVSYQGGGQFAVFSCNPGYNLSGPFILWCSGGRWSPSPPACV